MRKPKLRELLEALRAVLFGPATTRFPAVPSPAQKRFRGKIEFNPDKCILCGACVEVCPASARRQEDDPLRKIRREIHYRERCVYCGNCVKYCTTKEGIAHTREYDLAQITREGYEDSIESELVTCERCGAVITTLAHLQWIGRKVGELVYANPTLFLALSRGYGTEAIPDRRTTPAAPYRTEHMKFLCPACRRTTYIKEIWGY